MVHFIWFMFCSFFYFLWINFVPEKWIRFVSLNLACLVRLLALSVSMSFLVKFSVLIFFGSSIREVLYFVSDHRFFFSFFPFLVFKNSSLCSWLKSFRDKFPFLLFFLKYQIFALFASENIVILSKDCWCN